ncbi:MAG: hypothetical protein HY277_04530 [Ignavibacteriales bacterium]|nr:hypothetical protein [Ignavibacteriales bacterium]
MSKLFTSSLTCYLRLILLMLFCLLLVQNTLANNPSRARATLAAFSIINGQPLTINVGEDMSFQVFNSNIVGSGQIYPTDCQSTGDMGILVRTGNVLYAPDFNNHPCGTGATPNNLTYTAWTLVSLSAVSGTGAVNDPLIVTVIGKAGADLTLTMQVSYVNGDSCFLKTLIFENSSPLPISFDVFLASEPYLDNASAPFLGIPYHHAPENSIGQRECYNGRYSLFHIPVNTPADAYTAREYFDAWREISAGNLSNTLSPDCGDNVVALEWQNQQLQASSSLTIQVKTCLGGTPFCPPVATLDSVSALTQRWPVSNYPNIQGMTTLKGNTSPKIVYFTEYDAKKIGKMVLPPTVTTCDSATLTECDLLPLDLQPFKITYAEKPYRISDGNKTYSTNIWFTDPTHSKICGIVPDKPAKGVATVFTYDVGVYPPWDIQWYKPSKGTTLLWYSKPMMADRIFALQPVTAQVANIFYFVFPPGTQIDAFDVRYDYVWLAARDNDNDYLYRMPVSGGTAIRWALQKSTNRFTAVRAIYPAKPRSTQLFPYQVWLTRELPGCQRFALNIL